MSESVEVTSLPDCDFHAQRGEQVQAAVDGKTIFGPWANMCTPCFRTNGVGLGTGRGQRLVLVEGGSVKGDAT